MPKLLERAVTSIDQRLLLLAPPDRAVPDAFRSCDFDPDRHARLVREIQQFRGSMYVEDGAIDGQQLTSDGRHQTPEDDQAWHLLLLDPSGSVSACAWYREYRPRVQFGRLRLHQSPLASDPEWRDVLWQAVTDDIARAADEGLHYAEVGGWAVASEHRCGATPLVLALATYSLARVCGNALSITTATMRHGSCNILSRIGGRQLEASGRAIPPYYDARYRCVMQILRFDSRAPHRRYAGIVAELECRLADVTVVARPYWPMTRDARRLAHPSNSFHPPSVPLEAVDILSV